MDLSEHLQDQEPEVSTQVTSSHKCSLNEESTPAKHANPLDGILEKELVSAIVTSQLTPKYQMILYVT